MFYPFPKSIIEFLERMVFCIGISYLTAYLVCQYWN